MRGSVSKEWAFQGGASAMLSCQSSVVMVVSVLTVLAGAVQAGPLVREVTSSPVPYSQVLAAPGGEKDISLILDREEYDPLDATGMAVIRFQPRARRLDDLRVRLQLHNSQGKPVLKEE